MSQNTILNYIGAFLLSFLITYFITPFVKKLAFKVGAVDIPKDERRVHKQPIPRLGGLAIFIGFLISYLAFSNFSNLSMGLLAGSLVIVIVGIIDDIRPLDAKIKLVFQILAAVIVIYSGVKIQAITNPFTQERITSLDFYGISTIITILWIVGVTNAINFIDGLDGLAAGVSSIAAVFLMFIGLINGRTTEVLLTAILAGSTLGFLPFNFNPAKIFMGDTGSTFLGFALAVISIQGTLKSYAAIAILVPLLVLGLPIFDTAFAILRRIIKGRPIMEADRGHLHHRLIDAGYSQKQSVLMLYTISVLLGISAIIIAESDYLKVVGVVLILLVLMLIGIRYIRSLAGQKHRVD